MSIPNRTTMPDSIVQALLTELDKEEKALSVATDNLKRAEEEERRLDSRIAALKEAIRLAPSS